MDERQIVELFKSRDEAALGLVQSLYGSKLYATAYNILQNKEDAEECVSDLLIRTWNAIPPAEPQNLYAYLQKSVRNLALDRYRLSNREKRDSRMTVVLGELAECLADRETAESEFDLKQLVSSINRFLLSTDRRRREIFMRRYFYVQGLKEIAKEMSLKEANVRLILSRTRIKLKEYLEKEKLI